MTFIFKVSPNWGPSVSKKASGVQQKISKTRIYFFRDYRIQNAQRDHGVNESKRPWERSAARRSPVWANPLKCFDRDKKSGRSGAIRLSFQGIGRSSCGNWQRLRHRARRARILENPLSASSRNCGHKTRIPRNLSFTLIVLRPFMHSQLDGGADRSPLISRLTNHRDPRS